jgi:hypothetical protein
MSGSPVAIHAEGRLMRVALIAGFACALLIAGCSGVTPSSPCAQQPSTAVAAAPTAPPAPAPGPPTTAVATQTAAAALEAANPSVARPATPRQSTVKPAPAVAKAPAAAVSKAPVAKPKKKSTARGVAKKASSTLNLASLEQRLKDTEAIGVLTKIALKNEIDDLLDKFREFHLGKLKTTLAELRRPFDLLVLKVLSLLQDSDPLLASAIVASRVAIWGILADPAKFATVS